jgi:chemotaxis protein methyltransferase CheR
VVTDETEAFDFIIALIYERCRIRLHDGKKSLIRARLGKRMRHLGFSTLPEYCHYLQSSGDELECTRVVDALTTNFTSFHREADHFKFLVETALPTYLAQVKGTRRFQIWSAACATGEEPYSIAFHLAEHYPPREGWDWRILASDISTQALDKARQGVYPEERLGTLPAEWRRRYFQYGVGSWKGHSRVRREIAERVEFQQINLLHQPPRPESFPVVFCRNVMIYFDRPTQEQVVHQLGRSLVPGGYLLVGHSESLTGLKVPYRCLKPSIYQRQ